MAMTIDDLRTLLDQSKIKYFLAPDRPAVMFGMGGMFGHYQIVTPLEVEGQFLQFRTIAYASCPANHPHLAEVLKVLGGINYQMRLLKLGWDPSDGEVVAYADVWLMDGKLTPLQFARMFQNYVSGLDIAYGRIKITIETGKDPGEMDAAQLLERLRGGGKGPIAEI